MYCEWLGLFSAYSLRKHRLSLEFQQDFKNTCPWQYLYYIYIDTHTHTVNSNYSITLYLTLWYEVNEKQHNSSLKEREEETHAPWPVSIHKPGYGVCWQLNGRRQKTVQVGVPVQVCRVQRQGKVSNCEGNPKTQRVMEIISKHC